MIAIGISADLMNGGLRLQKTNIEMKHLVCFAHWQAAQFREPLFPYQLPITVCQLDN